MLKSSIYKNKQWNEKHRMPKPNENLFRNETNMLKTCDDFIFKEIILYYHS